MACAPGATAVATSSRCKAIASVLQDGKPPPNHAMDCRYRTSLDHRGKRAPVVITQLRALTWRLAVDQPIRPSRIKSQHPVANGLETYAADARCVSPRARMLGERYLRDALRANDDETNTCREFTLGGIGQTSSGYAPNQRQQDSCSSRR